MAKAAIRKRAPSPSTARPDALRLLREDHARVSDLFARFAKMRSDDRKAELVRTLCNELTVHATVEEEVFYPAVRAAIGDDDIMDEADIEHASAKTLIGELQSMQPGDDHYDARVTVLGEYIKHHVKEEQGEMFAQVRAAKLDLRALGEQMMARKQALQGELEGVSAPLGVTRTRA